MDFSFCFLFKKLWLLKIFPFLFIDYDAVVWIHLNVVYLVAANVVFFRKINFGAGDYGLPLQAKAAALSGSSGIDEEDNGGWKMVGEGEKE